MRKRTYITSHDSETPYNLCNNTGTPPNCDYIGDNKTTHMCFLFFYLNIKDRLDNIVSYNSMGITYILIKRGYKQPIHKDK